MNSLLSCPINRLSQFQYQIQHLLKILPVEHADHEQLTASFSILSNLVERIQDGLEVAENQAKMENVKRRIVTSQKGEKKGGHSLAAYGNFDIDISGGRRIFIKEGVITVSMPGKNRKKRHLFLFSDLLMLTKEDAKHQFQMKKMLVLDGQMEFLINQNADLPNSQPHFGTPFSGSSSSFFKAAILKLKDEAYTFYWKTEQEKLDWEPIIQETVHRNREGARILGVPLKYQLKREGTEKIPKALKLLTNELLNRGIFCGWIMFAYFSF